GAGRGGRRWGGGGRRPARGGGAAGPRRYGHTPAGREAAEMAGTWHLDRGRPLHAAVWFGLLLDRDGPDALPPLALLKAAVAFRAAGDAGRSDKAWNALAAKAPDGVALGGRNVPLADLRKELDRETRFLQETRFLRSAGWPMFAGDPRPSAPPSP